MSPERVQKLESMLQKSPNDGFLLYALAMEHKKTNATEAIRLLRRAIEVDAGHCYAYFQLGQTLELTGDLETAKKTYRDGITAAQRVGDAHAKEEIAGALSMIE